MNALSTLMESTYSTAKICDYDEDPDTCEPSLELEPRKYLRTLMKEEERDIYNMPIDYPFVYFNVIWLNPFWEMGF
jgi:hypothetical protein